MSHINVVFGAHCLDTDLAGMTVAEACMALKDVLDLDSNPDAYVDGRLVTDQHRLKRGQQLEFLPKPCQCDRCNRRSRKRARRA